MKPFGRNGAGSTWWYAIGEAYDKVTGFRLSVSERGFCCILLVTKQLYKDKGTFLGYTTRASSENKWEMGGPHAIEIVGARNQQSNEPFPKAPSKLLGKGSTLLPSLVKPNQNLHEGKELWNDQIHYSWNNLTQDPAMQKAALY